MFYYITFFARWVALPYLVYSGENSKVKERMKFGAMSKLSNLLYSSRYLPLSIYTSSSLNPTSPLNPTSLLTSLNLLLSTTYAFVFALLEYTSTYELNIRRAGYSIQMNRCLFFVHFLSILKSKPSV